MIKIVTDVVELKENEIALSLDKYGELTATNHIERAFKNNTKVVITDEVKNHKGKPEFNGVVIEVYGAGDGYVYTSSYNRDNDIRYFITNKTYEVDGSVKVDKSIFPKATQQAYKIANEFYLMLK